MSEFFSQANPETDREQAAAAQINYEHTQTRVVEELASDLIQPASELAARLSLGDPERNIEPVPTDVTIINPHRALIAEKTALIKPVYDSAGEIEKKGRLNVPSRKPRVLGRVFSERGNIHARYHNKDEPEVVGRGWVISRSQIRGAEHTVTLLESGELIMGGAVQPRTAKERRDKVTSPKPIIETLSDASRCDVSRIDLTAYPVNPLFTQERGYATTNGVMPKAVKDGSLRHGSEAARVAVNLERLEYDLRKTGRRLLKLDGNDPKKQ